MSSPARPVRVTTGGNRKLRGHGNGLAIALSSAAIADPTTPSRVAKVDSSGRLNTVDPVNTVNIATTGLPTSDSRHSGDVFSAPASAPLAVTKFSVVPIGALSATYSVYLFQVPVNSDGTCSATVAVRLLGYAIEYSDNGATEATPAAPRSKADAVAGR